MPLREFQCLKCNHIWEVLNPRGEQACPKCYGIQVKQRVTACNYAWGGLFLYWHEEKED